MIAGAGAEWTACAAACGATANSRATNEIHDKTIDRCRKREGDKPGYTGQASPAARPTALIGFWEREPTTSKGDRCPIPSA